MHKIVLRSLGHCLLMTAATVSQMIVPPIGKVEAAAADFHADLHRSSPPA